MILILLLGKKKKFTGKYKYISAYFRPKRL